LEYLYLNNNNFKRDLSIFSKLINLKTLKINDNPFFGSLKPLGNMKNLEELDISNTNIDSGLEYLPTGLKMIFCKVKDSSPNARCQIIGKVLSKHNKVHLYNYQL
jgi:Leucine-rich repeat (LRR) protein